eukprot:7599365-Pyramimonas_sp.AAC.1
MPPRFPPPIISFTLHVASPPPPLAHPTHPRLHTPRLLIQRMRALRRCCNLDPSPAPGSRPVVDEGVCTTRELAVQGRGGAEAPWRAQGRGPWRGQGRGGAAPWRGHELEHRASEEAGDQGHPASFLFQSCRLSSESSTIGGIG